MKRSSPKRAVTRVRRRYPASSRAKSIVKMHRRGDVLVVAIVIVVVVVVVVVVADLFSPREYRS